MCLVRGFIISQSSPLSLVCEKCSKTYCLKKVWFKSLLLWVFVDNKIFKVRLVAEICFSDVLL